MVPAWAERGALTAALVSALATGFAALGMSCSQNPGSQGSSQDSGSTDSTASGRACIPGMSLACAGPGGCVGYQVCNQAGTGLEPCDCSVDGGHGPTMGDGGPDASADGPGGGSSDASADTSSGVAPNDGSVPPGDTGAETGPLPTGCVGPYTPNRIACGTSPGAPQVSACNSEVQSCCGGFVCVATNATGCNDTKQLCDGPEDCQAPDMCVSPGGGNVFSSCQPPPGPCSPPCSVRVLCHADADCLAWAPYCVPQSGTFYALCSAYPPPADGGVVYGSCDAGAAAPVSTTMPCGSSTCQLPGEVCCMGASPVCQPSSIGCTGNTITEQCGSARNCSGGETCCAMTRTALGTVATCTGVGECNGFSVIDWTNSPNTYGILCITSADCPSDQPTCAPFVQTSIPMDPDAGWSMLLCQ